MKPAILCVAKSALVNLSSAVAVNKAIFEEDLSLIPLNNYQFLNRSLVDDVNNIELGSTYPHLIGYAVVKLGDKYLSYDRNKNAGETRLHGKSSIGFGGHVDISDLVLTENGDINGLLTLISSIERELEEELGLNLDLSDLKTNKLIYDTSNEVGKVHLGVPLIIEIKDASEVTETEEVAGMKWVTKDQLLADLEFYENWSKFIIQSL